MNAMQRLISVVRGRPRFEVRAVPVLDDVRAVLWMEPGRLGGEALACRALIEFDPIPGVEPRLKEDWDASPPTARGAGAARSQAESERTWVPPRIVFDPATVRNPRFRVRWAAPGRGPAEVVVPVVD
ncbi:MAG: hypothetical protein R3C39_14755 [Dehalococcoidia bacterium]